MPALWQIQEKKGCNSSDKTWMYKEQTFLKCRHCGCNAVMNSRDEFKKFMDEMECNQSYECERKENGDGR